MASTLDGGEHRNGDQNLNQYHTSIKPQSYSSPVQSIHYHNAGLSCCSNTNTVPIAPVSLNLHEAWRSIAAWCSQGRWHKDSHSRDVWFFTSYCFKMCAPIKVLHQSPIVAMHGMFYRKLPPGLRKASFNMHCTFFIHDGAVELFSVSILLGGKRNVTSGFNVSLNSQVKFEVLWFGACSGCPSYKYHSGH